MTGRSRHWTDEALVRAYGSPQRFQRTIRNWANVPTIDGGWEEAGEGRLEARPSKPPHWDGTYEFSHGVEQRAAQVWIRQRPRPLIGMRLSHRPDVWCNWRTVGSPVRDAVVDDAGATWPDAWPGCDLRVELRAAGFEDLITLHTRESARVFAWSLRLSPGLSVALDGGAVVFTHERLGEVWRTRPASAWDALGEAVEVGIALDTAGPLPIVSYTAIPGELSQWPITVDPTTTISGTAAIEDNNILTLATNANLGGATSFSTSAGGGIRRVLIRCISFAIPAGTLEAARWAAYASTANGIVMTAARILPANTWAEGTHVTGATQTGSSCWNYAKYDTQPWAGAAGCSTANVDYSSTDSVSAAKGPIGYSTFSLPVAWFGAWRTDPAENNGFRFSQEATTVQAWSSTEAPANQPYFEIDYTVAAASALPLLLRRRS